MLAPLKDLLNFAAFRPTGNDSKECLRKRFIGRSVVGVEFGYAGLRIAHIHFPRKGEPVVIKEPKYYEYRESGMEGRLVREAKNALKTNYALVLSEGGWTPTLAEPIIDDRGRERNNLASEKIDEIAKFPPKYILERSKLHTFIPHHEYSEGLVFAMNPEPITERVAMISDQAAVVPCRTVVGVPVILEFGLLTQGSRLPRDGALIVADLNGLLIIRLEGGHWVDVGFSASKQVAKTDEVAKRILERIEPYADIAVMDGSEHNISGIIMEHLESQGGDPKRVTDIFEDHQKLPFLAASSDGGNW